MKKAHKYNWENRGEAITMWRESGLTQSDFCKREGIARSTFQHWMRPSSQKRLSKPKTTKEISSGEFIPVNIKSSVNHSSSDMMELFYPNGVTLKLKADISLEKLQQYILLV